MAFSLHFDWKKVFFINNKQKNDKKILILIFSNLGFTRNVKYCRLILSHHLIQIIDSYFG